jgi:hypothetical protein
MPVRPTDYTIWAQYLKSWAIEGSVDSESWTEIDRQTDSSDFKHASAGPLLLIVVWLFQAVEFFLTLSESIEIRFPLSQ